MMKPVGGKIVTVKKDEELITWQSCGYLKEVGILRLQGFYIINEDTMDIYVKINDGDEMLLKQGEMYNFTGLTSVGSCKVTSDAQVRWAGLIY